MSTEHHSASSIWKISKHLVILLVAFGILLAAIYFLSDAITVRKLLIRLAMPVGLCWVMFLTSTYFLYLHRQFVSATLFLLVTLAFTVGGNSWVARHFAQALEEPYRDFDIQNAESYDVVVLLGGGTMMGYHGQPQLGIHGDRLVVTIQMYANGKAKRIICTGSPLRSNPDSKSVSPGEQSRSILVRAGIPEDKIELLDGRNTSEEIRNLAARFGESDQKVAVVSSAWHLPRVMRLAKRHGFRADPIPANFKTNLTQAGLIAVVPSAGNLMTNTNLLKEWLAKLVGQ